MGQPSTTKPSCKNSLRPVPHWKRKLNRKRNPYPSSKPNQKFKLNPNRRKQQRSGNTSLPQDHATYHPPRLQDLQFQNRLRAFRHFAERHDASVGAYPYILDGLVAQASGFPASSINSSRVFLADAHVGGTPQAAFDFLAQGAAYTGSFACAGKDPSFPISNPRLINSQGKGVPLTGSLPYTGKYDSGLVPGVTNSLGTFNVGFNKGGNASTSGVASAFLNPSGKGKASSKRYKAFHRPRRAAIGARKMIGAPAAPRNTTSFLMRAKKAGGIASFFSPSPVTPALVSTPVMSPFPPFTGLADEANQEWGVDDYGSMNGLIRLRSVDFGGLEYGDNNDSESEVEQGAQSVQQLEQRLDHDVSRFVMTYPANRPDDMGHDTLDILRIDDQDSHIAHLEEENMDLKERLYSLQQEVDSLRQRLQFLEGFSCDDGAEAKQSPERSVVNVSCS